MLDPQNLVQRCFGIQCISCLGNYSITNLFQLFSYHCSHQLYSPFICKTFPSRPCGFYFWGPWGPGSLGWGLGLSQPLMGSWHVFPHPNEQHFCLFGHSESAEHASLLTSHVVMTSPTSLMGHIPSFLTFLGCWQVFLHPSVQHFWTPEQSESAEHSCALLSHIPTIPMRVPMAGQRPRFLGFCGAMHVLPQKEKQHLSSPVQSPSVLHWLLLVGQNGLIKAWASISGQRPLLITVLGVLHSELPQLLTQHLSAPLHSWSVLHWDTSQMAGPSSLGQLPALLTRTHLPCRGQGATKHFTGSEMQV